MNKYDIKNIEKYIKCKKNNLKYTKKLESDPYFMMLVINYTNDPIYYDYCNKIVKHNYNFIKYMVNKFSYDINLIERVYEDSIEYFNEEGCVLELNELTILMDKYTKGKETSFDYEKSLDELYDSELKIIRKYQNGAKKNPELYKKVGKCFLFIYDDFQESKITTDYMQKDF